MSARFGKPIAILFGGEPRVNLLPPEVIERGKARATRRMLGFLVVVALVVVGGGYGAASLHAANAQAGLVAAQDRTQALLVEQIKYSDATTAASLIAAATSGRQVVASTEVLWNDLLDTIETYLPEGASLDSGTLKGRAPWEPELTPGGPLRQQRVATLTLVVKSSSLLDASAIIRKLADLPGFADATPDLVELNDAGYRTTITLNVSDESLSGRFQPKETKATK